MNRAWKGISLALLLALSACASAPTQNSSKETSVSQDNQQVHEAVIETSKGEIVFSFYTEDAPNTVANFVKLTQKGFYNGLTFHRVVPNFVIQGGDPSGDGTGGPGYSIKAEFNSKQHLTGTVAMARSADPNSAGSQFYICLAPQPFLDHQYTVFGQVTKGLDVIQQIRVGDTMSKVTVR
jgi:peptidylprolyl isomerase/peptidyl-prolyl cis-trans isomerase B (cyclophilin B)